MAASIMIRMMQSTGPLPCLWQTGIAAASRPSPGHEERNVAFLQQRLSNAAQRQFEQPRMDEGTHHDVVGLLLAGGVAQRSGDIAIQRRQTFRHRGHTVPVEMNREIGANRLAGEMLFASD